MKRKIRLREKTAFVLFLVSMSAMDSDSRVVAVIIIITTLGILFYAGQAYRKEGYEKQSIMAHDGHSDGGAGCL